MAEQKETAHERFLRLSAARTERAVHHILLLRNLASNDYENSPEEADSLVAALQAPVDEVAEAFGVAKSIRPSSETQSVSDQDEEAELEALLQPAIEAKGEVSHGVKYETDFPTKEESLLMLRLGPKLGKVMEALMDEDQELALNRLVDIMKS
ncbi:MAG: hypothetical protein ABJN42_03725 [Roseibium sp.]|uniref:hypothetical protein n=1 Tax=Roseibium sp. TaxID=1936156 RepID=UPI00329A6180